MIKRIAIVMLLGSIGTASVYSEGIPQKETSTVEPSKEISECIAALNQLAQANFPIHEVKAFFRNIPITSEHLKPYMFFSDTRYTRNLVYKTDAYELLVLCWKAGQKSPIHGHEGEKCWLYVAAGTLEFINYREEADENGFVLRKANSAIGSTGFVDGPAVIHQVSNLSKYDAISLHLYARPFNQCDIYEGVNGQKRKVSIGYHSIHGKLVEANDQQ